MIFVWIRVSSRSSSRRGLSKKLVTKKERKIRKSGRQDKKLIKKEIIIRSLPESNKFNNIFFFETSGGSIFLERL